MDNHGRKFRMFKAPEITLTDNDTVKLLLGGSLIHYEVLDVGCQGAQMVVIDTDNGSVEFVFDEDGRLESVDVDL